MCHPVVVPRRGGAKKDKADLRQGGQDPLRLPHRQKTVCGGPVTPGTKTCSWGPRQACFAQDDTSLRVCRIHLGIVDLKICLTGTAHSPIDS